MGLTWQAELDGLRSQVAYLETEVEAGQATIHIQQVQSVRSFVINTQRARVLWEACLFIRITPWPILMSMGEKQNSEKV